MVSQIHPTRGKTVPDAVTELNRIKTEIKIYYYIFYYTLFWGTAQQPVKQFKQERAQIKVKRKKRQRVKALYARDCSFALWNPVSIRDTISVGAHHTIGLKTDGTVVAVGWNEYGQCDVSNWVEIKLPNWEE